MKDKERLTERDRERQTDRQTEKDRARNIIKEVERQREILRDKKSLYAYWFTKLKSRLRSYLVTPHA